MPSKRQNRKRAARRRRTLRRATPRWVKPGNNPERRALNAFYRRVKWLNKRERGTVKWTVDHIVPLCSELVCGLHVAANLQIITEYHNIRKSNTWWPDGPFEQLYFTIPDELRYYQLTLAL